MDKARFRQQLRQQRRKLEAPTYQRNCAAINHNLRQHPWLLTAKHIAVYLPNDGEPDITGFIDLMGTRNRTYYLPCLNNFGRPHMVFRQWLPGEPLYPSQYGIPEPGKTKSIPAWALSVVLMPLVGFDRRGQRLGMGAGYYDRTFMFRRGGHKALPHLVGIAHDFQEVDEIDADPWDIPLDLIVTDQRIIEPRD